MVEEGYKECPHCGEEIKLKAIKCKHCHSFVGREDEPVEPPPVYYERREDLPAPEEIPPEPSPRARTRASAQQPEPEPEDGYDGKGFILSLFDLNMTEMITPKIIKALFIVGLLIIGLGLFTAIISSIITVGTTGVGRIFFTLITASLGALIAAIFLRVYLELIILFFNIFDQLKEIRAEMQQGQE